MEPEHRRAVRSRLAQLLGQKVERVLSGTPLVELARDPRRLGEAVQKLQREFGVSLGPRDLAGAHTVEHLVGLVADAAGAAPPGAAPAAPAREARAETYLSAIAYEGERIRAAAVYCSDGRIGDHVDDFLHNGLGLPRYDRLACPGGPIALAGRLTSFWECHSVEEQLRFLLHVHDVRQVVLIAHQPCAYYGRRLHVPEAALESEQQRDLRQAAWTVQRADPSLEVAGFVAWPDGGGVRFEKVLATTALATRVSAWQPRRRP